MLPYELRLPERPREGAPLVVLLHGRGSNRHDLIGFHSHLPPGTMLVTPEAPFPGAPWGYGPGSAWYRFIAEGLPDEATLTESLARLDELLGGIPAALPVRPGSLALGGFSQGGTASVAYALTRPGVVDRVINLSGFVPKHPDVRVEPDTVNGARWFWGHGTSDAQIPFRLAEQGRAALRSAGADLTAHDYPMGHGVAPAELRDLRDWLARDGSRGADSDGARNGA
jgi:phospholipase/carboxylesterase